MGFLDDLFAGQQGNGGGISPASMGLLGAAAAYAPSLQYSRLPQNPMAGLLSAAGGFGSGYQQGQQSQLIDQEAQQRQLANIMTRARYQDIAQRHPEWFPQGIGGPSMGGGGPASSMPNPMQVAQANQPGQASDAGSGPNNTAGPGQVEQQLADRMKMAQNLNYGPNGITMGAPPQGAPQMPQMPQGLPPTGQGNGGITAPTNLTDASDLLFMHPELKDVVTKQFPGPTDAQRALAAAGVDPNSPQGRQMLQGAAFGAAGLKPVMGGERQGVPFSYLNPATGRYEADTSQLPAMEQAATAASRGTAMGSLGAKEAESAFKAGLDVKVANETAKRKAFYETGVMPPDYNTPSQGQPQVSPTGDIATSRGTVVPAPPKATPFMGTDAISKQNTNTQDTEKNFGAVYPALGQTESRLVATAQALKIVEGRGFNEDRAAIANKLSGLGLNDVAQMVMGGKEVAAVQSALALQTLDVLGQLKQINQGTGGKVLNSEFTNLLGKQYGPDLKPEANYNLITQALGGIYQTRNMIDDYYQIGKPSGWGRDANAFVSTWQSNKANGMPAMVKQAGDTIGPLRGMEGGPAGAPAQKQINYDAQGRRIQ